MQAVVQTVTATFLFLSSSVATYAQGAEGVLARCGASKGTGYVFYDEVMNPEGPMWEEDGISNGKIVLVKLGDEWDVQFDDAAGSYGYREDGAQVLALGDSGKLLTIGAFRGSYADIYTFNLVDREVIWTSHKIGTLITKVAIYRSECEFMASP